MYIGFIFEIVVPMINHNGSYKSWKSFRLMGRKFLALERIDGWEIYGDDCLTPMYTWHTIERFKKDAVTGKLPEFFKSKEGEGEK